MTRAIGDVLLVSGFLGALVFVVVYLRSPWWTTAHGRNVMAMMAVIMILLGLATATAVFGLQYPARDVIRVIGFGALSAVVWWRVVILIRTQRRDQ